MNIVYTLNDKFVPQVSASICSICENNMDIDQIEFFIISKGITDSNKKILKEFIESYNRKTTIVELENLNSYIDFEFDTMGWNPIVLARLILDKLLEDTIEKIIYIDGDTIVRGSLKELWDTNLGNNVLAASIEPTVDKERKKNLGLEKYPYYNAGVLLIDLKKWKNEEIGKKILDFYKQNNGRLFANDQDAINAVLAGRIYTLLPKYNFYNIFYQYPYRFLKKLMEPVEYIKEEEFNKSVYNPVIIHYLGEERPWRIGNSHKYKDDYIKYLNKTSFKDCGYEKGWKIYFIFWNIFNFVTKPFPKLRYNIINSLIPAFMKLRAKKVKKSS